MIDEGVSIDCFVFGWEGVSVVACLLWFFSSFFPVIITRIHMCGFLSDEADL